MKLGGGKGKDTRKCTLGQKHTVYMAMATKQLKLFNSARMVIRR